MSEYGGYRDLAVLCITFDLTNKGNGSIGIDKVKEKIEEIFPEEKSFSNLLQRSESTGSILVKDNSITVTEMGIETAQRLCESIRRTIKIATTKFRCVSNVCQGKNIILRRQILNEACPHCGSTVDLREVV